MLSVEGSFGWARSRTSFQESAQARLVKLAHGRLAVWLDPFGMLPSQVVVNLLLKLGHGVDRVADRFGRNLRRRKHNLFDKRAARFVHWKSLQKKFPVNPGSPPPL